MRINSEHEVPSRSSCVISALTHHTFPKPLGYLEDIHSQLKLDGSFFFLFPLAVSFFSILETLHRLIILHVGERVCTLELEAGHITSLPHYTAMLAWKCFKWTVFPWQCMSEIRVWGKKTNTNKHGCFVISTACFCLSLTPRFSLCLPSDCWVESVRVCKQQKCVHWRDRFPSADNEAPFPHEEAVSILSLTVATCAWRAINSLGSPCLFESCPSAPPCKAVLNFSLLSSAWPRLHKCHFNAPKNLTSKGPMLFETSIHSQMFDVHIFKKLLDSL